MENVELFQAIGAKLLGTIAVEVLLCTAEGTAVVNLPEQNIVVLHADFNSIMGLDTQTVAKFYRQDNAPQFIDFPDHTRHTHASESSCVLF
jgi:hypothetical protein